MPTPSPAPEARPLPKGAVAEERQLCDCAAELARRDASDKLDRMDISINAPTRIREPLSFSNFVLMHKGDLTLAFSFFIYLVSLAALMFTHYKTASEIAVSMAEAALIGGLCDYIALKMIFERRWYLPNSGVLPRNRAKLIDGIAATIENEWLTPTMIGRRLNEMDLVGRLGTYLEEVRLDHLLGQQGLEQLLERLLTIVDSPESREH